MNWIIIAGHLGVDPEERFTPGGQKVISFRVAVRTRRKGEDDTIWYRVTVWGDRFDKMMPYLKKGSAILVTGELHKPDIYTNRDGQPAVGLEITAHNLQFSPFGRSDRGAQEGGMQEGAMNVQPSTLQTATAGSYGAPQPGQPAPGPTAPVDDDLPF